MVLLNLGDLIFPEQLIESLPKFTTYPFYIIIDTLWLDLFIHYGLIRKQDNEILLYACLTLLAEDDFKFVAHCVVLKTSHR
jgi:hypothetical protein